VTCNYAINDDVVYQCQECQVTMAKKPKKQQRVCTDGRPIPGSRARLRKANASLGGDGDCCGVLFNHAVEQRILPVIQPCIYFRPVFRSQGLHSSGKQQPLLLFQVLTLMLDEVVHG
jgi:hypothetical protein